MPHARIVVIGASAGGLKAVRAVLAGLPAVFPAGALSDGTLGLQAIKHAGGLAVVQHPITCPSCGGTISEVEEEGLADDECYVGHRFDAESARRPDRRAHRFRARRPARGGRRQPPGRRPKAGETARRAPRPGGALAATREQARLSKEMHQAARRESRPRTSEKPRANGKLRRVSRRRK